ncbi:hypothetical protein RB614_32255 [Phytohabitans sp. ZYX-F-186]|uniref:Uncharacterized protein n=1 Tax=Phytohabitans maris TaxID=3071409 RepID=A0ABU0ZQC6_9ACTN|nr:hypothetical protein [Phytohabitans sp. ZYX-F-186]MDQ7909205.1 hypothetical protein [Phytohabitans sp. ZYX-F-186]
MKLRVYGMAAEVAAFADLLRPSVTGRSAAGPDAARDAAHRDWVRRYVTFDLYGEAADPDPTAPRCPWCKLPYILDQHGPAKGGMSWSCRRCARTFIHAEGGVYLAAAEDVATLQVGDLVLLHVGWRTVFDVRVTRDEVEIRTDVPTDPLTGFRLRRVLTRREIKPWHDGPTYPLLVHVVRDGQRAVRDL